ncbi:hypothetical protein PHMEG_00012195 [Phytophthora megakarya]|uniref:Uncharacterized protein n=1 Tax=Phytophthora megakarya TaxID=4795 RepID=A0A225W9D6_9STRA|nr:hypothetical protein PHMEG_00012195 [Phytophthora megakarya]
MTDVCSQLRPKPGSQEHVVLLGARLGSKINVGNSTPTRVDKAERYASFEIGASEVIPDRIITTLSVAKRTLLPGDSEKHLRMTTTSKYSVSPTCDLAVVLDTTAFNESSKCAENDPATGAPSRGRHAVARGGGRTLVAGERVQEVHNR